MHSRLWKEGPQRSHLVFFDPGEEVIEGLASFARDEGIEVASMTGIGGFQAVTLGFYDPQTQQFGRIPLDEDQVEVLSFIGDITTEDGARRVHGHVVLGTRDGTTRGGHLLRGIVRPLFIATLEELSHEVEPHHR